MGHHSEELQRTTARIGCRNSHLKSAPQGHCRMSDGAQTTRTFFFVEGTHVHWQATAEQFFFSKFNMHVLFILYLIVAYFANFCDSEKIRKIKYPQKFLPTHWALWCIDKHKLHVFHFGTCIITLLIVSAFSFLLSRAITSVSK